MFGAQFTGCLAFLNFCCQEVKTQIVTSNMRLTFITDTGQTFVIEIDPQMELENIMALLEVEVSAPQA